jgi:putative heme transporter
MVPVEPAVQRTPLHEPEPEPQSQTPRRRVLHRMAMLGALVFVFVVFAFVLPKIANYGQVWEAVNDLSTRAVIALLAAAILNLLTFAPPWMAALPGLRFRQAMILTQASTALSNVMPGGDAVGVATAWAMLRRWGFDRARITLAAIAFSVWNQLVNVAFPILAVVALAADGERLAVLGPAAVIGTLVLIAVIGTFTIALRGDHQARLVGDRAASAVGLLLRVVRKPKPRGWGEGLAGFRAEAIVLLRRRWLYLTAATVAGHLTVFLVLLVSLRAVGVESSQVSVAEAFAAWSLVRLLTAVPLTPGGVGVVELGLTGALVALGGPQVPVVAAVLIYRFLTFVPPIPIGLLCTLFWAHTGAGADETADGRLSASTADDD